MTLFSSPRDAFARSRDASRDAPLHTFGLVIITINPLLASLGPLGVRWFGLLALVGLGLAIWGSLGAVMRQSLGRKLALDALAWALPVGLLTARLTYVLGHWDFYLTNGSELWQANVSGLSLWGGLVGGGLVAAARLGRYGGQRRRLVLDAIAPFVLLGIAVGRIGEFLDGSGQGLPSSLPWATMYASPLATTPDFGVPRHPVQVYDALVAVALFGLVWAVPRAAPAGTRAAAVMVSYGVARVALGALRLDPPFLFGLQIEQLLALGAVACGVGFGMRPLLGQVADRSGVQAAPDGARRTQTGKEDSLAA